MTRSCYDSTNATDVPTTCDIVAGYIDGRYKWSDDDWARFPGKPQARIAVFADTDDGNVLDVEDGDATPSQAPVWVAARRAAGVDPTVYCSLYAWPTVRQEFIDTGVREPHWWIASYDNVAQIPAGAVAKQYANEPLTGGHYDASIVEDYWPGVDDVVSKEEFEAYQADVKATIDAMKAAYDPLVKHWHPAAPNEPIK